MLKVYNARRFISIDGKEWRQVGWDFKVMRDDSPSEILMIDNISFSEFYALLQDHPISWIDRRTTLFRKRPKICINYDWDYVKRYTKFNSISCKITYEEIPKTTLHNIMKFFPADQAIQYLKERGITTCPMNF